MTHFITFCVVPDKILKLVDGTAKEFSEYGWFGYSKNQIKNREEEFIKALKTQNPEDWIVNIDCHV